MVVNGVLFYRLIRLFMSSLCVWLLSVESGLFINMMVGCIVIVLVIVICCFMLLDSCLGKVLVKLVRLVWVSMFLMIDWVFFWLRLWFFNISEMLFFMVCYGSKVKFWKI